MSATISHTYRSYTVLYHNPFEFEVPYLGMTLPTEAAAHKAIDADLEDWLEGYNGSAGTPSAPVDGAR